MFRVAFGYGVGLDVSWAIEKVCGNVNINGSGSEMVTTWHNGESQVTQPETSITLASGG